MSERDALMRHIIEHPEDDAPRLVFADWLDEHGEPERAEFIRLQIAQERMPDNEPFRMLRRGKPTPREAELLADHGDTWRLELPALPRRGCGFRRGFAEDVKVTGSWFGRSARSLWRRSPIAGVYLAALDWHALARQDLDRLRRLMLVGPSLSAGDVGRLGESTASGRLRELNVPATGREVVAELARSPALIGLRSLRLVGRLTPADTATLTEALFASGLEILNLAGCGLGDDGVRVLARSPALARLRRLVLTRNDINTGGAFDLAASPHLAGLVELNLFANRIGLAGRSALRERFGDRVCLEGQL